MIRRVVAMVRAWTPGKPRRRAGRREAPPEPRELLVLDWETTDDEYQEPLVMAYAHCAIEGREDGVRLPVLEEGIVHPEGVPEDLMRRYVARRRARVARHIAAYPDLKLLSLSGFLRGPMRHLARRGELVEGFNLPFDLSRTAWYWAPVRRRSSRYAGGFRLRVFDTTLLSDVGIRQLDPRRSFIGWLPAGPGGGSWRGAFLDLRAATYALTGEGHSLESACEAFGVPYRKRKVRFGRLSSTLLDYCRGDVRATVNLAERVLSEHRALGIARPPWQLHSPASVAKDLLERLGVTPPLERPWDLPEGGEGRDAYLGYAFSAFFGGRAEAGARGLPVPGTLLDFKSQYPAVSALLGLWDYFRCERIRVRDSARDPALAEEVQTFLDSLTREALLDPTTWRREEMRAFDLVDPAGAVLPVRAAYDHVNPGIALAEVLRSSRLLWYAVPDVAAGIVEGGARPRILRVVVFEPVGRAEGLRPLRLPDGTEIDPREGDLYTALVEARVRMERADLAGPVRDRWNRFLKIVANSLYGTSAEMVREPGEGRARLHGLWSGEARVSGLERPGEYAFPPVASLTTAGGRLLLALARREVERRGGIVAFCDTDSLFVSSREEGGLLPYPGGRYRTEEGEEAVRLLTGEEVDEVRRALAGLNPFDRTLVPDLLKVEETGTWAHVVSAKRYALLRDGEVVKPSAHGLGHLLDPRTGEKVKRFEYEVWDFALRLDAYAKDRSPDRREPEAPPWAGFPAMQEFAASTPRLLGSIDPGGERGVRPFTFGIAPVPHPDGPPCPRDPGGGPHRLFGAYRRDPAEWTAQRYTCVRCERRFRIEVRDERVSGLPPDVVPVLPLGSYAREYVFHPGWKADDARGAPCDLQTVGVLRRPRVEIVGVRHVGKEGNLADLRAEGTADLVDPFGEPIHDYGGDDPWEAIYVPVARILGPGRVAEAAGVPPRTVRYALAGRRPSRRTRAQIEGAVRDLIYSAEGPIPAEGWRLATGGASSGPFDALFATPEAAASVLLDWSHACERWASLEAASRCPSCGEWPTLPHHDCPRGPCPACGIPTPGGGWCEQDLARRRTCACGCGVRLPEGSRSHRRYASAACRKRAERTRRRVER